jgi:hypothetical protein
MEKSGTTTARRPSRTFFSLAAAKEDYTAEGRFKRGDDVELATGNREPLLGALGSGGIAMIVVDIATKWIRAQYARWRKRIRDLFERRRAPYRLQVVDGDSLPTVVRMAPWFWLATRMKTGASG